MMRIILMGPPGVGKGTQATRLKNYFKIVHLSTGDLLRTEIANHSTIGKKAKSIIDQGHLVPDYILLDMIEKKLQEIECKNGYLLDGFPRTIPQAEGLDKLLDQLYQQLNAVISLYADEAELVHRLVLRGRESGRSDDSPEIIRQRQNVYWDQTAPLLDYYRKQDLLQEVNGIGPVSEITDRILKTLA
ncbi:MAG: adenylate kinase [Fidelibacterota bacterium]